MRLNSVSLPVLNLSPVASFYRDVLGLDVTRADGAAHVQAGATSIKLYEESDVPGSHHLAFSIPTGKFAAAKAWVCERAALLRAGDGEDEFETFPSWNAHSVYFKGPESSVLELIERRDLDNSTVGAFSAADLLSISEIGVAVPDVRAAAERLQVEAGLTSYGGEPEESFAAVGDVHGLLILVSPGRIWFPTSDRRSAAVPTSVQATGGRSGNHWITDSTVLRLETAPAHAPRRVRQLPLDDQR